ncbi:MAG: hypothetical protein F6K31_12945 [Symploca sp. SIO2G7]|nr:hypothetical protein [Symploca sp. SIO2G7]
MTQYIKAEAVPVHIGNLEFDGIRIVQTGEYRMSQSQILKPVNLNLNWLTTLQFQRPEIHKALLDWGFTTLQSRVKYSKLAANKRHIKTRAVTYSLDDVFEIWSYLAFEQQNKFAIKLVKTLGKDSLQDRYEQAWNERRSPEQRRADDCRILDAPQPWTLMFEHIFETELSRISGLHKNHIRNSQFYWEFVYSWLTQEERTKLDEINPVLSSKRRKHKIHACLTEETKDRLSAHVQAVLILMQSANSVDELRRLVQRRYGMDQINLFDGWWLAS